MEEFYLCKCCMCDEIYIDNNPQVGAVKHPLANLLTDLPSELEWDKDESAWFCPHCHTDAYLMDL